MRIGEIFDTIRLLFGDGGSAVVAGIFCPLISAEKTA
jgi:hypothetical protein